MLPFLNHLMIVMSLSQGPYSSVLTLLVLIPIVVMFQLNGKEDVLVRIIHQVHLAKDSLSMVEDVRKNFSLLPIVSATLQLVHLTLEQHALQSLMLVNSQPQSLDGAPKRERGRPPISTKRSSGNTSG